MFFYPYLVHRAYLDEIHPCISLFEQLALSKFAPGKFVASSYVQDVRYADFAGAKIGKNKISIREKLSKAYIDSIK